MESRRGQIFEHYLRSGNPYLLEKSAASVDRHRFRGARVTPAVVIRSDLNGYSKWAKNRDLTQRAALLSDYFTKVVALLNQSGGIYFRDEGDCIVSIFSPYFEATNPYAAVPSLAKKIVSGEYGNDKLTAKVTVAAGDIAVFQKAHEVGTNDWSAEGDPFVRTARLEQAVQSEQKVYYFESEYRRLFDEHAPYAEPGRSYRWLLTYEKLQVPGLALDGGWADIAVEQYLPSARVSMAS